MINLNNLREQVYKTACSHGLHNTELSNDHFLMLVITELSEAVVAYRKGRRADRSRFEADVFIPKTDADRYFNFIFTLFIKNTVEFELADAVIRLLDLAGLRNVNMEIKTAAIDDMRSCCEEETFTESVYSICTIPVKYKDANYPISEVIEDMTASIFGLAQHLEIDLMWHIENKMTYNSFHERLYGKKY